MRDFAHVKRRESAPFAGRFGFFSAPGGPRGGVTRRTAIGGKGLASSRLCIKF